MTRIRRSDGSRCDRQSDEVLSETVKAFFEPRINDSTGSEEWVVSFCTGRLALRYLPKQLDVLPGLFESSTGKPMKGMC